MLRFGRRIFAALATITYVLLSTLLSGEHASAQAEQQLAIIRDENVDVDTRIEVIDSILPTLDRNSPQQRFNWSVLQGHKGFLLRDAVRGTREDNLEMSIAALQQALTVLTPRAFPEPWARTQNNLGISYRNRVRGDPVDNAVRAITAYEAALSVYTAERYPQHNAETLTNLRIAQRALDRGLRGGEPK
jgi:hypothetical protein